MVTILTVLIVTILLLRGILWMRSRECVIREHDTVPIKRIGRHAFVVSCTRCGWLYLKTYEHGRYYYRRYRGQFDDFEDYATEPAEAEPTFADGDVNV